MARIIVEAKDQPVELLVNQPGEKLHRREIVSGSSYEFECANGTTFGVGNISAENVNPDALNQRPSPNSKAHPGQTSITSGLQPEDPSVTAQRETGQLPYDADIQSPFAGGERGRAQAATDQLNKAKNEEHAKEDGALSDEEKDAEGEKSEEDDQPTVDENEGSKRRGTRRA